MMDYFMNNPCIFHHISKKICKHLSLKSLKNLSLVSKQWFEITAFSIPEECVFKASNCEIVKKNIRHYGKYKIESCDEVRKIIGALHASMKRKRLKKRRKKLKIILSDSILTEDVILGLFCLENLESLDIIDCKMGDGSGEFQVPNSSLKSLKTYNSIPLILKNAINSCKNTLKRLHLTTAKDGLLSDLEIPFLEEFTVWEIYNIEELNAFLKKHKYLKYCNFEGVQLTDETFTTFSKHLSNLKTLKVNRYSDLSDYALRIMKELRSLENLSISRIKLSEKYLSEIGSQNMKSLDIGHLRTNLSLKDFEKLFSNMPNLTELNLSYCKHEEANKVLTVISKILAKLRVLDLSGTNFICGSADNEIRTFHNLQKLSLNNSTINNQFLKTIYTPKLHELDICLKNVSSKITFEFILNIPYMRNIYLRYAESLNDRWIREILLNLKYLDNFEIGQCSNVSIETLCTVLFETFIPQAFLTLNSGKEELFMVCRNRNFTIKHDGIITEIKNGSRIIYVQFFNCL